MFVFMRRLRDFLIILTSSFAGLSMILLFLIVLINALQRYTVGRSLVWGENMAVYLMIYGIMFGIAWAYLQDKHVRFNFLQHALPASGQRAIAIAVDLLVLAVGIGLAISAMEFMDSRGHVRSPSTGLSMWMFQAATLIGGVLLAISALNMAILRLLNHPFTDNEEAQS